MLIKVQVAALLMIGLVAHGTTAHGEDLATWWRHSCGEHLAGTVLALHLFVPVGPPSGWMGDGHGGHLATRGNWYSGQELMVTALPLALVLMQLASMLCVLNLWLRLQWTPRTSNVWAGDLAYEVFYKFEPSKRIMISWEDVPQDVMGPLLLLGKSFTDEVAARRG